MKTNWLTEQNMVIIGRFVFCLFLFTMGFSQIQQDPRIGLLPYHERLKALQQYEEIRRFQDNLMVFQEKAKKYDLSVDLQKNNPRQFEQNLRALADLQNEFAQTIKFPSSFTPQMRDVYYQDFAEKRKSLINTANEFRRSVRESIEREKGKIVENFVKNTIITAVAVVATVVTAGASSPLLVGAVANWGTDLALASYQYYNLENRDVYDAINWSRSEEYKAAQVTASAAKVAIGFGTGQLGYDNALKGAQTTLQIASVGQPYYNQDTNKTLVTAQTALSVYSSSVDLARDRNATSVVAPSKQVATEINPQYAANYATAQRWELVSNISRDISATTQIVSSLSTLYAVYNPQNTAAAKLSSDLNFYSSILSYGSQIPGGIATRLTVQANERIIGDYAFIKTPHYEVYNLFPFDKYGLSEVFTNNEQDIQGGASKNPLFSNSMLVLRSEPMVDKLYEGKLAKIKNSDLSTRYNVSYEFLHRVNDSIRYNEEIRNLQIVQTAVYDTIYRKLGGNYYEQYLLKKGLFNNNFVK
jgi:hypothetical protein